MGFHLTDHVYLYLSCFIEESYNNLSMSSRLLWVRDNVSFVFYYVFCRMASRPKRRRTATSKVATATPTSTPGTTPPSSTVTARHEVSDVFKTCMAQLMPSINDLSYSFKVVVTVLFLPGWQTNINSYNFLFQIQ
jgi:hypothetical protein